MFQSLISAETGSSDAGNLEERLLAYPQLYKRIEALLNVVENSSSEVETADLVEKRVIEEVRQIGHQTLSSWAENQHQKQLDSLRSGQLKVRQHLKKNSTGTLALEPSRYLSNFLPKGKENP